MVLYVFVFALIVFTAIGAFQIHGAWKRRRQQREEIERAMRRELQADPHKEQR